MTKFPCGRCAKFQVVPAALAGQEVICPSCNQPTTVPGQARSLSQRMDASTQTLIPGIRTPAITPLVIGLYLLACLLIGVVRVSTAPAVPAEERDVFAAAAEEGEGLSTPSTRTVRAAASPRGLAAGGVLLFVAAGWFAPEGLLGPTGAFLFLGVGVAVMAWLTWHLNTKAGA